MLMDMDPLVVSIFIKCILLTDSETSSKCVASLSVCGAEQ